MPFAVVKGTSVLELSIGSSENVTCLSHVDQMISQLSETFTKNKYEDRIS